LRLASISDRGICQLDQLVQAASNAISLGANRPGKQLHTASVRFLKTDQRKNRVVWPPEMSHNILQCNDATASPKRLRTTKIQIPDEDRIVKKTFCCKLTKNPGLWAQEA